MSRQTVPTHPLWGWPTTTTVEVERVSQRGDTYAVDAVFVNGTHAGFVFGRADTWGGKREWDYLLGTTEPTVEDQVSAVYPTRDRKAALAALVEAHDRA